MRYASSKEFFRVKMTNGSSIHDHYVNLLTLVEKLSVLNVILDNGTYVDVLLQSLPPSFDQFVVDYYMNGLEKSIPELINILVQHEAEVKKPTLILLGAQSDYKSKGKKTQL
ncbi:UNVERIFIED_CONTAM: hypothetical protein Slati_0496500 [Sesamum latifolium]|uniref:Uncharacterized protein n=1 Tax=Sesamum latifolium TaxID=2727402 RepID=A0AAW2XYM8_9LAMI